MVDHMPAAAVDVGKTENSPDGSSNASKSIVLLSTVGSRVYSSDTSIENAEKSSIGVPPGPVAAASLASIRFTSPVGFGLVDMIVYLV
jgi:hypothetical protein